MLDDAKKLVYKLRVTYRGNEGMLLQKYIVPRKKKPQIYRVDISKNNVVRVYVLKAKAGEYSLCEVIWNSESGGANNVDPNNMDKKLTYRRISYMNEKFSVLNIKEGSLRFVNL